MVSKVKSHKTAPGVLSGKPSFGLKRRKRTSRPCLSGNLRAQWQVCRGPHPHCFPDCLPHFRIWVLQVSGELSSHTHTSQFLGPSCAEHLLAVSRQRTRDSEPVSRGPGCQAWQLDFYFRDPHGGRREQTPACSLASVWYKNAPPNTHVSHTI